MPYRPCCHRCRGFHPRTKNYRCTSSNSTTRWPVPSRNEMRESTRYDTCPLRGKGWRCFSWAPACFPSRCMPLLAYRVMFRVLLEDGWWTRSMTLIGSLVWSAPRATQVEQLFRILRWRHVKGHDTTSSVSPAFRNSAHAGCDDVHAGDDDDTVGLSRQIIFHSHGRPMNSTVSPPSNVSFPCECVRPTI